MGQNFNNMLKNKVPKKLFVLFLQVFYKIEIVFKLKFFVLFC